MIVDSAAKSIEELIASDIRFKTTSKGLARSLVWRNGVPPPEMGENFGASLTEYLQVQADRGVIASLRLIESNDSGRSLWEERDFIARGRPTSRFSAMATLQTPEDR